MRIGARRCRFETLEAADGRLRLVGGCGRADASFLTEMRIEATYAPTGMAGTVTTSAYSQASGGIILRTTLSVDSAHFGACP